MPILLLLMPMTVKREWTVNLILAHPLEVASILVEFNMDIETICAALMHDVLEDCDIQKRNIEKIFGKDVAEIVDGVSSFGKIEFQTNQERNLSSFQKWLCHGKRCESNCR